MLGDQHAAPSPEQPARAEQREHGLVVVSVRRIEKGYVPPTPALRSRAPQKPYRIARQQLGLILAHAAQGKVRRDEATNFRRMIYEGDVACAARQGLYADGPRACAQVQKARLLDPRPQNVE
jgi:hypothetical protein